MAFTNKTTNNDWLTQSMIGRVREMEKIADIQGAMIVEGCMNIEARYMGDNMVLLRGEGETQVRTFVEENKAWMSSIFESIEPWNESCIPGNRIV